MEKTANTNFTFGKITAQQSPVSENEKALCREWFDNNIRTATKPAYSFCVDGKELRENLGDWDISIGKEGTLGEIYRNGKTSVVTLTHKKSSLVAKVEATIYEDFATCEWTVFIENTGKENSPVISNFHGANFEIQLGKSDIYFSNGSDSCPRDFELHKAQLDSNPMIFNADDGRSTSYLPFFNICGKDSGIIICNSWTGQWYSSFGKTEKGVKIIEKQEYFEGYLTAGEKVRSPLVSICFYEGNNPLKGFNTLRSWEMTSVYTESAGCITCTILGNEFDMRTDMEYVDEINSYDEDTCKRTDYLWKDAGWYKLKNNWYDSIGNWEPDPNRFPNGYSVVSDAAEARGMKSLLWYEPERCCKDTDVYNECIKYKGGIISRNENVNMVNLAIDECCEYLGNLVANSLRENKIGLYRQDFNFTPLSLWLDADKTLWGGRVGIEENHYVTNLYRYLDRLLEVNPGLVIDNCASGGRRLDIEMTRRSIPLWRTDYNCADEHGNVRPDCIIATQCISYGISFWLPLTGSGLSGDGEYLHRSLITPCTQRVGYEEIRAYLDKNYYPLTNGLQNTDSFHGMQYGDGDQGVALIYKREDVKENEYRLVLNGLSPEKIYTVSDYDGINETLTLSGNELMTKGIVLRIDETPKAVIIQYS